MNYGHQLTVEGVDCHNAKALDSTDSVAILLTQCVEAAGMTMMQIPANPVVGRELTRTIGRGPGITGCALLNESHCVIHTYPKQEKPWFFFELLSCKKFEADKIVDILKAWASPSKLFTAMREIGQEFPPRVEAES